MPVNTIKRYLPFLVFVFLCSLGSLIHSQSMGDNGGGSTQISPGYSFVGAGSTTVGVTGNVVTVSSSGGGGGSAASALTNANNLFTTASVNTFNAPTHQLGVSNVVGLAFTTNYFYGSLMSNTNAMPSYTQGLFRYSTSAGSSKSYIGFDSGSSSIGFGIIVGNLAGSDNMSLDNDGSGNLRLVGGDVPFKIQIGAGTPLSMTSSTLTFGNSSSYGTTMNAATMAIPNGLNIGSGVWNMTASSGITNNNSGIYSRGTVASSNFNMYGALTVNRKQVSANYTNVTGDYYIGWKGMSAGTVTNFIATNSLVSGSTLIFKDISKTAALTNIVLFPIGAVTIDGNASIILNSPGESATLTYDGVGNLERN